MKKYDVAAYIWPAYTAKEPRTKIFWPNGIGEWETVTKVHEKENGYVWKRTPLWGVKDEAEPETMEEQIEKALDYGVNVFIYDWYWYDRRPFLEQCLNDGFLKAKNNKDMKFYIMWANHDANCTWDIRNSDTNTEPIWLGSVDRKEFEIIGKRWIEKYFHLDNYYKIDDCPVVSIYDLHNFVNGLGGIEQTKEAIKWLKEQGKKAGFPDVHLQFVKWGENVPNISGVDSSKSLTVNDAVNMLGFSSVTHYQYVHFTDVTQKWEDVKKDVLSQWEKVRTLYDMEYFPHVSIGWDNNPRYKGFRHRILEGSTPREFEKLLEKAREYSDKYNKTPLIVINSWNEWTETSYLMPDDVNGDGYLQAIRNVFKK